MDTVSETVSKVDEGLQEMGIDGVKDSLKDLLNFKQYMENQVPAVMGFCIKVVLSVIVFFVGRKIIQWILNVMRRSLERANVDAGVIQFASSAGKAVLYVLLIINIAVSLGVKESSVAAELFTRSRSALRAVWHYREVLQIWQEEFFCCFLNLL